MANRATWLTWRLVVRKSCSPTAHTAVSSISQFCGRNVTGAKSGQRLASTASNASTLLRNVQEGASARISLDGATGRDAPSKRKTIGANAMRNVAVEAQRSRKGLIKGKGKLWHVNPDVETKDATAYCAADQYDLSKIKAKLIQEDVLIDPHRTGLYPQVLHIQSNRTSCIGNAPSQPNDLFIFPNGCLVTWDVEESHAQWWLAQVLADCTNGSSHLDRVESEDLEYLEDSSKETSQIVGDTIILGTGLPEIGGTSTGGGECAEMQKDTTLAKIAFSSALARSTKLAVLEGALDKYFQTTRSIPQTLSAGKPLRITRSQILRKTGELLSIRAQLNLYSELTDSLPDVFWDSPHELGLEGYYDMAGRLLDVGVRIRVLNEKMDYASEIAAVLRERLSEKHSSMLEWMIIGLICIEVGFGIIHLWRESTDIEDNQNTRALAEQWLMKELGRDRESRV